MKDLKDQKIEKMEEIIPFIRHNPTCEKCGNIFWDKMAFHTAHNICESCKSSITLKQPAPAQTVIMPSEEIPSEIVTKMQKEKEGYHLCNSCVNADNCPDIDSELNGCDNYNNNIPCIADEILSSQTEEKEEGKPEIVCICGSGRFLKEMHEVEEQLTLEGKIVLMIGVNTKDVARTKDLEHYKPMLDELHLKKIDMSDLVVVVMIDSYIGESTRKEIDYSIKSGKKIKYMEMTKKKCHSKNVPNDCTDYGHIEGKACSRCEFYYEDIQSKSPAPPQTVIMPSDSECFTKSDKKEKYHLDNMTVKYNKGVPETVMMNLYKCFHSLLFWH